VPSFPFGRLGSHRAVGKALLKDRLFFGLTHQHLAVAGIARASEARGRRGLAVTANNQLVVAVAFVIMCLGILIGGHLYGRYLGSFNSPGVDDTIIELRIRSQFEKSQADSQAAELTTMEARLKSTQGALDPIMPSPGTYTIKPNQTLIVGDGHLTVGMVGAPGNDAIMLNVNGMQQPLAAGQTINVAPDPATQCQLSVQSFNVFKATLVAACSGPKAK
jgi:hypothetical protein